jgi:hypothetical protein
MEEMSADHIIDTVNASQADFLCVSLGARKGQPWHRNYQRITVPVRAHLGAVINFQAGTVKRAPSWLRQGGAASCAGVMPICRLRIKPNARPQINSSTVKLLLNMIYFQFDAGIVS